MFRAAAMRNPVTNIPSMASVSDIPDWCHVEACGVDNYEFSKFYQGSVGVVDTLSQMHEVSPIKHVEKVQTPTLMLLGMKDRRVPASQGLEYYHVLKDRGVVTKMLCFPEDVHAIDKPLSEAEQWISITDWFMEHRKK